MTKKYRLGVVGVFQNDRDELLVCERSNRPGAWQFPQGGIDEGETRLQTLEREMCEELGTDQFEILSEGDEITSYEFPPEAQFAIAKAFCGQRHHWFLLRFKEGAGPDLSKADGEFSAVKWVPVSESLNHSIAWKHTAYQQGLKILGFDHVGEDEGE